MAEFSLSPLIPSRRWIEIEMATSWNFGGHLARLVVSVSSSHFGWLSPSVSSSTGCSPPRPFDCVHSQKRFPMCFHLTATLRIYTFCKLPYAFITFLLSTCQGFCSFTHKQRALFTEHPVSQQQVFAHRYLYTAGGLHRYHWYIYSVLRTHTTHSATRFSPHSINDDSNSHTGPNDSDRRSHGALEPPIQPPIQPPIHPLFQPLFRP